MTICKVLNDSLLKNKRWEKLDSFEAVRIQERRKDEKIPKGDTKTCGSERMSLIVWGNRPPT